MWKIEEFIASRTCYICSYFLHFFTYFLQRLFTKHSVWWAYIIVTCLCIHPCIFYAAYAHAHIRTWEKNFWTIKPHKPLTRFYTGGAVQSPSQGQARQAHGRRGGSCAGPAQGWGREQVSLEDPFLALLSTDLWNLEAFLFTSSLAVKCGHIWENQIVSHNEICWLSKCASLRESKVQILGNAFHYRIHFQKGAKNLQELQQSLKHLLTFFVNRKLLWIQSPQHHSTHWAGKSFDIKIVHVLN